MAGGYAAQVPRVLGAVFGNRDLRRIELAFVGFNAAEWGTWIAILVYAYDQGGATAAGLVALAQLVPAGLFAPFVAVLADRCGPARVLAYGYAAQAAAMAATGSALLADGPPLLAYALAAVAATSVTTARPAQAALVPSLARSPDELTATNVVSGWIEGVSVLVAPAATGVILGFSGAGTAFAVMAAVSLASALTVGPLAARMPMPASPASGQSGGALTEAVAGFRLLARQPQSRLLVVLLGAQFVGIGALDVLFVVLALGVLDMGEAGAGYLNAAFGAGGTLGLAVTVTLVGRRRLLPPLLAGVAVWGLAFLALGLSPTVATAVVLLAVAGMGRSLVDVAGRTLLQRTAPPDLLSRVFGVLEGLTMAGLAVGSVLTPIVVALAGAEAAAIVVGATLPLVTILFGRRLLAIDRAATVPVVEVALLRALPLFRPLGAPELETLARSLVPVELSPGDVLIRQGEPGDRFYAIADGTLEVTRDGTTIATRARCDGVGEIALLRAVPRTATVTALTPARVYGLDKAAFLTAVTGHAESTREAERMASERLESLASETIAP